MVYQVKRDGFALSWLAPYADWDTFQARALAGWTKYDQVLQPQLLHNVVLRFINRLDFPRTEFSLSRCFTAHPSPIPGLAWQFGTFNQQVLYSVPDSACAVQVVLAQVFDAAPETLSFVLDVEVKLKESFSAAERSVSEVLSEMRELKNRAFFGMLTPETVERYR